MPNFLERLKELIDEDPTKFLRNLADLGCSQTMIVTAVGDLGTKSYVCQCRQLLTSATKVKRVEKSKKLTMWLKHHGSTVQIFSDKKIWRVDQARNSLNDRYLAYGVDEVPPINTTKFPASAMMLDVVASDGKRTPPIWFPASTWVGKKEYLEVMESKVKLWLDATYPASNYMWQQDGALSHTSKKMQKWMKENLANFWNSKVWPRHPQI